MTQNLMARPVMAQPLFSLDMPSVDELFPDLLQATSRSFTGHHQLFR